MQRERWSFQLQSLQNIISVLIRVFPPSTEFAGFLWPLSSHLAILYDHMHPLSPVHFSSFHSLLIAFLFLHVRFRRPLPQFKFQSLHCNIFNFFSQNMTVPLHSICFRHPIQRLLFTQHVRQLLGCFFALIASRHTSLESSPFLFF